ncbi:hypothetical protein ABT024_05005 [Streptomyces sp. NPDC002812]|uniref:hypothetical protein n=1 Tax=Streptomyces sp. NPDC002812 TaxID=3154434 RepID=UPI0033250820
MSNQEEALAQIAENMAFDMDISLPTARAVTERCHALLQEFPDVDTSDLFSEQVKQAFMRREPWAWEYTRAGMYKQMAGAHETASLALQVGGDPYLAVTSNPDLDDEIATGIVDAFVLRRREEP